MPKARLGVALLIPEPYDRDVNALRLACGDPSLERIPPHLTLVPPVNVREDRMDDALRVLREAGAATTPFELVIGPPATFMPVNPVLYLDVAGDVEALLTLRDRVFVEPLARELTWPFVPHVTIADEAPPERIEAALTAMASFRVRIPFERVHLLREGPGRLWAPIADAGFATPAVIGRGGLELELRVTNRAGPDAAHLRDRRPFAITARRDGDVVGVAHGWSADGVMHVDDLVVAEPHRRQGIAGHLAAAVRSLAAERECADVEWPARDRSDPAPDLSPKHLQD